MSAALDPVVSRAVQARERSLAQSMLLAQQYVADDAQAALDAGLSAWPVPQATPGLTARFERDVARLIEIGKRDAVAELIAQGLPPDYVPPRDTTARDAAALALLLLLLLMRTRHAQLQEQAQRRAKRSADELVGKHQAGDGAIAAAWAATEATRFYTAGRVAAIRACGGAVWGFRYVVILDSRTSDYCRPLVGRYVPRDEARFFPPFHWYCRTTVAPVLIKPSGGLLQAAPQPMQGFGDPVRVGF